MKKWLCAAAAVAAVVVMSSAALAEWQFTRKVDIVCPWGAGGGADSTIRALTPLLEKLIGVEIEVVNITGGSGVGGLEYAYKQEADGYTYMLGTQSLIMRDLHGVTSMDFKTAFIPVAKLVHSVNIIAGSKKALEAKKCSSFADLVAYAKDNPFDVSAGMLTSTGVDSVSLRQSMPGVYVNEIPFGGGYEMNTALAAGDIDITITGVDEISDLVKTGDIVPLCAVAEKRIKIYPDMPCTEELGIHSVMGPWRGIFAKDGTPDEAVTAMAAAVEEAVKSPEWQAFLAASAYDERPGYAGTEEFKKLFDDEYVALSNYLREEKILKKEYN